jgi:hypothetical protein
MSGRFPLGKRPFLFGNNAHRPERAFGVSSLAGGLCRNLGRIPHYKCKTKTRTETCKAGTFGSPISRSGGEELEGQGQSRGLGQGIHPIVLGAGGESKHLIRDEVREAMSSTGGWLTKALWVFRVSCGWIS